MVRTICFCLLAIIVYKWFNKRPLGWGLFFCSCTENVMDIIVIALIIVILFSLDYALVGMIRGGEKGSDKMFKSLRLRISLSVFLFILLMFASFMGWIEPNNVLPTQ